ncbi:hypothetical protein [Gelidibacter japonicus]|uniref:hypothetical protein n=1 Tax=Gelidibacter japonicus TaxID=1962232 RepID=UPI003A949CD7
MEKINKPESKETLVLTKAVFITLIEKIIEHFRISHKIDSNYKETQLFGFGNYDLNKANLKNELELIIKGYINGKYLYNKNREALTGKPFIKISREYKYVFFNYLGYKDVNEFINQDFFTPSQKSKQLEVLHKDNNIEDFYYASYYYGEDKKMNKGHVVIYNQWKSIEMKYIYEDDYGKTGIYSFFGNITNNEGFVFFDTKFYNENKKNEGAKFIFFIGKSVPHEREYLIGTYSGFDKYDNTIAGKMILKKFDTRNNMEIEVSSKLFDPIICQELNKKRIVVESVMRKSPLLFSTKSPYAHILDSISNKYLVKFYFEKKIYSIKVVIENSHLNIKSLEDSLFIENDRINLINNGQIIHLDFSINGLFYIQEVSIYVKSMGLIDIYSEHKGQYTATDVNNNIISGVVEFKTIKYK